MEFGFRNKQQQANYIVQVACIYTARQSQKISIAVQCYRLGLRSLFKGTIRFLSGNIDKESHLAMITGATAHTHTHTCFSFGF